MTLALAAFAFAANAQFVLGGNLGAFHTNYHTDEYATGNVTTDITIMPKVGYWLNDKMQIGMQFGWGMEYRRYYLGGDDKYGSNSDPRLMFTPYFRYNVATWKNFTVFCEAQANLTLDLESSSYNKVTDNTTDNNDAMTMIGLRVVPGMNYAFNEHFSMDLYINIVSAYWAMATRDGAAGHQWGLGVNMEDQTINSHLHAISVNLHQVLNGHTQFQMGGFLLHAPGLLCTGAKVSTKDVLSPSKSATAPVPTLVSTHPSAGSPWRRLDPLP